MRFVLCDDDALFGSLVEAIVTEHGHDVLGIADNPADAIALVEHGRPDVLVVDPAIGCNADFDVIATATDAGVRVVVFSRSSELVSERYTPRPIVVHKPYVDRLEDLLARLEPAGGGEVVVGDRRVRPTLAARGPVPTWHGDAAAFYEALNNAAPGDALLSFTPAADATIGLEDLAEGASPLMRAADRLLILQASLVVLLVGGGPEGLESFRRRMDADVAAEPDVVVHEVVIEEGEEPAATFERLRRG